MAHAGIARTYQIPRPFKHMTVLQNVTMVAMFGWMLRLGVIVAILFGLHATADWFSARSFGFAAIATALAVAVFETRAWLGEAHGAQE